MINKIFIYMGNLVLMTIAALLSFTGGITVSYFILTHMPKILLETPVANTAIIFGYVVWLGSAFAFYVLMKGEIK